MKKSEIKQARLDAGFTQAKLAKEMNTTVRSVSRWETGERNLTGTALVLFKIIVNKM